MTEQHRAIHRSTLRWVHRHWEMEHPHRSCLYFAMGAIVEARRVGVHLVLQAGEAYWPIIDLVEDDGTRNTHFGYEYDPDDAFSGHVWAAEPETGCIVDMTTFMLREQVADGGAQWDRIDDPQPFIWARPEDPGWMEGASYVATEYATRHAIGLAYHAAVSRRQDLRKAAKA